MEKDLSPLEKKLGVTFNNQNYLRQALIHRSYLNENRNCPLEHNERLEFLGDAVLELIVTEHLYNNYPNPEGELTNWRSALVNGRMLAKISRTLDIEDYIYMSRGEQQDTGKARDYILANAFEAVMGAIYLDQGYNSSRDFTIRHLLTQLDHILENQLYIDAKTKFQELCQEQTGVTPSYRVLEESGPDHDKNFRVGIYINSTLVASGKGSSKQTAQQDAAKAALKKKNWE